jgi:hypothetical protein
VADGDVLQIVAGAFENVPVADAVSGPIAAEASVRDTAIADAIAALTFLDTSAANVPAVAAGALVLLSDVITAYDTLEASHNDLLAKLKAAGLMVPD